MFEAKFATLIYTSVRTTHLSLNLSWRHVDKIAEAYDSST